MQKKQGSQGNVKKLKRAAFFDVDKTLIYGDSQALEAKFILKKTKRSLAYIGKILFTLFALQLHRMGWISLDCQNKIYIRTYCGRTRPWLEKVAADLFCQVIENKIIPGSLALIEEHKNRGDLIVLVSATTHHLLIPLETYLKPDKIFCTHLAFDENKKATGRASGKICVQEEKRSVVRKFARDMAIDLDHSFAYSDHHSDIPLLESVGHPIAINPTKQLAACAKDRGWPLYRF